MSACNLYSSVFIFSIFSRICRTIDTLLCQWILFSELRLFPLIFFLDSTWTRAISLSPSCYKSKNKLSIWSPTASRCLLHHRVNVCNCIWSEEMLLLKMLDLRTYRIVVKCQNIPQDGQSGCTALQIWGRVSHILFSCIQSLLHKAGLIYLGAVLEVLVDKKGPG